MINDKGLIQDVLCLIQSPDIDILHNKYSNIEELLFDTLDNKYSKTIYGLSLIRETLRRIFYCLACQKSFYDKPQQILYYMKFLLSSLDQEKFYMFYLDKKGFLTNEVLHNVGTIDRVSVYPREILKAFIYNQKPWGIIMVHNHPSGDVRPSTSDISITQKIQQVLDMMDIHLVEHVIISKHGFSLMKQDGYV